MEDGSIQAASRNRQLTLDNDNRGFFNWAYQRYNLHQFFMQYPNYRLFGEWLIPHSLKSYEDTARNKFYVFDVIEEFADGLYRYLPYDEYAELLERFSILYIPRIARIYNPTYDDLQECLRKNHFLIKETLGVGEGIVIKNYDFVNQFQRITWAKLISSEFNNMAGRDDKQIKQVSYIEEQIVQQYITSAFCEKEYEKFIQGIDFQSNMIGGLLSVLYNEFIREEAANIMFEFHKEAIDINRLRTFAFKRIKQLLPNLF